MEDDKRKEYQRLLKESPERVVREISPGAEEDNVYEDGHRPKRIMDMFEWIFLGKIAY